MKSSLSFEKANLTKVVILRSTTLSADNLLVQPCEYCTQGHRGYRDTKRRGEDVLTHLIKQASKGPLRSSGQHQNPTKYSPSLLSLPRIRSSKYMEVCTSVSESSPIQMLNDGLASFRRVNHTLASAAAIKSSVCIVIVSFQSGKAEEVCVGEGRESLTALAFVVKAQKLPRPPLGYHANHLFHNVWHGSRPIQKTDKPRTAPNVHVPTRFCHRTNKTYLSARSRIAPHWHTALSTVGSENRQTANCTKRSRSALFQ